MQPRRGARSRPCHRGTASMHARRPCAGLPGFVSACVYTAWWRRPGSCSWEHMLSLLAGCSVPGSSPGRGGGSRKTREQHCVCRAGGYPGKPPCQGGGVTSPSRVPHFLPLSWGLVCRAERGHRVSGKPQRGGLLAARRAHAERPESKPPCAGMARPLKASSRAGGFGLNVAALRRPQPPTTGRPPSSGLISPCRRGSNMACPGGREALGRRPRGTFQLSPPESGRLYDGRQNSGYVKLTVLKRTIPQRLVH